MSLTPVKAIILDVFDTVLLRRQLSFDNPYTQILSDLNVSHPKTVAAQDYNLLLTQNISFADFIDRHADTTISVEQRAAFLHNAQQIFAQEKSAYTPRPEWKKFLDEAYSRDFKICLGSNLSQPYTEIVEEKLGDIPHKIYSCDIGIRKPNAAFFHACCDIMNVEPHETIMIGNSFPSDVKGAQNAKLAHGYWIPLKKDAKANTETNAVQLTSLMDVFAYLPRL